MISSKTLAFFLVVAASTVLSSALPPNGTVIHADYWAQFCEDTECSQNCGSSVQVSNPGCLTGAGSRSILFHGAGGGDYSLVVSPTGNCPCQEACETVPTDVICWDISQYEDAQSFRFIGGGCDSDNC
ncbi:hypothetical protein F5Y03DRAFT_404296 [Xylaria venustula]|nr:hypothetical protein F5Y03DRAFT_404296 [Xylaria venustula]